MLKFIGAVMIAAAGGLWGLSAAWRMKKRVRNLEKAEEFIEAVILRVEYSLESTGNILDELCGNGNFSALSSVEECRKRMFAGEKFPDAWRGSVYEKKNEMLFSGEEAGVFASISDILGKSDAKTQTAGLRAICERMAERKRAAEKNYAQKGEFYKKAGFLLGIGAALVLI